MKTICNIILSIFCFIGCFAQAQKNAAFFNKGDRVCFVGNSITHNGEFHHNIFQYYVTRYPKVPISFYNAGVKGDVTGGILKRIENDIMINNPTHIVIMIGMNDVQRNLYKNTVSQNKDTLISRKNALVLYQQNLDSLVAIFVKKGLKVILQKPSPYDETAKIKTANGLGINNALNECGKVMQQLADKYKLPIVDYWTLMTNMATQMQAKKPEATLTVNDRVHPNSIGHLIMAYQFLKSTNSPTAVSKIVFDVKKIDTKSANSNCTIQHAAYKNDLLHATILENALPFPINEEQFQALALVPFIQDLNVQQLQIKNLPKGNYQLLIDGILIDNFSDEALKQGINLANYNQTPQYKQALQVNKKLKQLWEVEATIRGIAFVEYMYLNTFLNKENLIETKKHLDSIYNTTYKGQKYYEISFGKYITYKPQVLQLRKQLDSLQKIVYELAQPIAHTFTIKKATDATVMELINASQSGAAPLLFNVQPKLAVKVVDEFKTEGEFYLRNGLPNFFNKMNQKNPNITVGFLGGSITKAEDQYRNQTLAFIQTLNPKAKIKGINAGVSGTGTELGACRVNEQVLKYQPDLVFVEFAVNGGSNEAMEGIVRQIIKNNTQTDICFIYTIAGEQYKNYAANEIPAKIKGFEKIATHYNLPSIHMGLYPSLLEKQGKLIWKSAEEISDKIIFSKDGTHPLKAGGDLYAQAIMRAFNSFKNTTLVKNNELGAPLYKDNWEDGGMYTPQEIGTFSNEWKNIKALDDNNLKAFAPWFTTIWKAVEPDASFSFTFNGTAFGFFDIGGPEVGQVNVEIDGRCTKLIRKAGNASNKLPNESGVLCLNNRFNSNCNNRYRGQFEMFDVPNGIHEVKITLTNIKANKLAILEGQDLFDIKQNPDKYNEHTFYLGKILLKGAIVKK